MNNKIENLISLVKNEMGNHCIDVINRVIDCGQLAFLTDEIDNGENIKGQWVDIIKQMVSKLGFAHLSIMPYPVDGHLIYVVAGLNKSYIAA